MEAHSTRRNWPSRLRRADASRYLKEQHGLDIASATLAKWFSQRSDGPPVRKFGRFPMYEVSSLDSWAIRKLGPLRRSSSDRG